MSEPVLVEGHAMGWLPDLPDVRDHTPHDEPVQPMLQHMGLGALTSPDETRKVNLPTTHDLRSVFASIPVENQKDLGSCTANAAAGLMEYYEKRAMGHHIDASRLFIYKTTRNLLGWTGDTGAYMRTTMAAMRLFGAPPEKYWPYTTARPTGTLPGEEPERNFDTEPPAFCYAFGEDYEAIDYYRLDPAGAKLADVLQWVKAFIAYGLPAMFGFTVYSCISQASTGGKIPFPSSTDSVLGGHAVVAVGYDDSLTITHAASGSTTTGALIIRNSWGPSWGDKGYGYLPYDYVLKGLARDWWALLKQSYVDNEHFGLAA